MGMILGFFRYTFGRGPVATQAEDKEDYAHGNYPTVVDEVPALTGIKEPGNIEQATTAKLILIINWTLAAVLLLSLLFIMISWFVFPNRSVPSIVENTLSAALGYFGASLGGYWERSANQAAGHKQSRRNRRSASSQIRTSD